MTIEDTLSKILAPLNLGAWEYHPVVGSTNDRALAWAADGAPDWSLVLADTQTAGRGRGARHWVTRAGTALAMSLVLRPSTEEVTHFSRFTALAALAVIQAVESLDLTAQIKWPNDILLNQKKVGGVLVEADWKGASAESLVVGMGVNITPDAVPSPENLRYPATSVGDAAGHSVDRWMLLGDILRAMRAFRATLLEDTFVRHWNAHLAFREQWILFSSEGHHQQRMKILSVDTEGRLILQQLDGNIVNMVSGEILMAYN